MIQKYKYGGSISHYKILFKKAIWFIGIFMLCVGFVKFMKVDKISIKADDFGVNNDAYYCHFIPAVGIFYDKASLDRLNNYKIHFDLTDIKGEESSNIGVYTIHDLANIYIGHVCRYNKALRVSLPPKAKVVFGFWGYNYASHAINIYKLYVPMSLNSSDISHIIDIPVINRELRYINKHKTLKRQSKFYVVNRKYTFYNKVLKRGYIIGEATLKTPIQVIERSTECLLNKTGDQRVEYSLAIRNNYNKKERISVFGSEYQLLPGVTQRITHNTAVSKGEFKVSSRIIPFKVLSRDTECTSFTGNNAFVNNPIYKQIFVSRDDISYTPGFRGIQPGFTSKPDGYTKSMCVTRIPYQQDIEYEGCHYPANMVIQMKHKGCIPGIGTYLFPIVLANKGILLNNVIVTIKLVGVNGAVGSPLVEDSNNIRVLAVEPGQIKLLIKKVPALNNVNIMVKWQLTHVQNMPLTLTTVAENNVIGRITHELGLDFCRISPKARIKVTSRCLLSKKNKVDHALNVKWSYFFNSGEAFVDEHNLDMSWEVKCFSATGKTLRVYGDSLVQKLQICNNNGCIDLNLPKNKYGIKYDFLKDKLPSEYNFKTIKFTGNFQGGYTTDTSIHNITCVFRSVAQGYTSKVKGVSGVTPCYSSVWRKDFDIIKVPAGDVSFKMHHELCIDNGKRPLLYSNIEKSNPPEDNPQFLTNLFIHRKKQGKNNWVKSVGKFNNKTNGYILSNVLTLKHIIIFLLYYNPAILLMFLLFRLLFKALHFIKL